MPNWSLTRLGDVADEITVGYVGPMASEYTKSGVPFLRSQNVRPHRIDLEDVKYVSEEFHHRLGKSSLRPGDVVTVRTGKPGQTAVVPGWLPVSNCSDLVITRPGPRLNPGWLSYYLNWITETHISGYLVGAVQQHFNVRAAENLVLELPPLAEQRAIAEVLGALDDKIAANTKLIATGETLMVSLAATAVDISKLSDLATQSTESVRPEQFSAQMSHYSLPAFDAGAMPDVAAGGSIKSNKFLLRQPAVLMSKLNPRIPRVWNVTQIPEMMAVASTEFVVLYPSGVETSELWAVLSQPDVSIRLGGNVAGTSGSHQRVKPAELLAMEVRDPRGLAPAIRASLVSLGQAVHERRDESAGLAETRDALLPLLMSGKLRVKDAERVVEEAV